MREGENRQTYAALLAAGREQLDRAGIAEASLDGWLLLEHVTGMKRAQYYLQQTEVVPQAQAKRYMELIARRSKREPLQYITGSQEFMGLSFAVTPDVLIPRQDTETLVETALPCVRGGRVLDLCTGSGCIAVSLAHYGDTAYCMASDISKTALAVAKRNAVANGAGIAFVQSNLFEKITQEFDVIVSNPPYIPPKIIAELMPEVRAYEPTLALSGGEDGLSFYRRIASEAPEHLTDGGRLFLEIGSTQAADVSSMLAQAGFDEVQVKRDYAGNDRVVFGKYKKKRGGESEK